METPSSGPAPSVKAPSPSSAWVSSRNVWNIVHEAQSRQQQAKQQKEDKQRRSWLVCRLCSLVRSFATTTRQAVQQDPKVLIIPLLWMALSMALGLWAVHASAHTTMLSMRNELQYDVGQAALFLDGQVAEALYPNQALQMFVTLNPNVSDFLGPNLSRCVRHCSACAAALGYQGRSQHPRLGQGGEEGSRRLQPSITHGARGLLLLSAPACWPSLPDPRRPFRWDSVGKVIFDSISNREVIVSVLLAPAGVVWSAYPVEGARPAAERASE